MPEMPAWETPKNLAQALEDSDGFWEDERWSPIVLTAISGTEFNGREIPVAWQVEFDPFNEAFADASATLARQGIVPDGYGWGAVIQKTISETNPALANRLHLSDCETDTCVIWVESDEDCRLLLETTWTQIFDTPSMKRASNPLGSPGPAHDFRASAGDKDALKIFFNFVAYNSMGGHPTLSFLGNVILGKSIPHFGLAVTQIEVYAHLQSTGGPLPTLEGFWERFREHVSTMPKAWFRRKTRRIEIAYFSHLGFANDLIVGRSRQARVDDVPLFRTAYRELIDVLENVRKRVKKGDDFDAAALLRFLSTRKAELDNESDEGIQRLLLQVQEIERHRIATSDDM